MNEFVKPVLNRHTQDSAGATESLLMTGVEDEDSTHFFENNGWVLCGISDEPPQMQEQELWVQVFPKEIPQLPSVVFLKKISSLEDLNEQIDPVRSKVKMFSVFIPTREHTAERNLTWKTIGREHIPEQLLGLYPEEQRPDKTINLDTNEINQRIKQLGTPPKNVFRSRLNREVTYSAWRAIKDLPVDTLKRYHAHGSVRGEGFEHAIRIIETNAITGYFAPLAGGAEGAATTPYYDGCLLVVSKRSKSPFAMNKNKPITVEITEGKKSMAALDLNAGAFVISDHYRNYVEPLRAMYPNANILYAEELRDYILDQERMASLESAPDYSDKT